MYIHSRTSLYVALFLSCLMVLVGIVIFPLYLITVFELGTPKGLVAVVGLLAPLCVVTGCSMWRAYRRNKLAAQSEAAIKCGQMKTIIETRLIALMQSKDSIELRSVDDYSEITIIESFVAPGWIIDVDETSVFYIDDDSQNHFFKLTRRYEIHRSLPSVMYSVVDPMEMDVLGTCLKAMKNSPFFRRDAPKRERIRCRSSRLPIDTQYADCGDLERLRDLLIHANVTS